MLTCSFRAVNQQVLLDAKVGAVKDAVIGISTEATQEAALEDLLAKVVTKWATIELAVVPYKDSKDVYILGSIDNVQVRHRTLFCWRSPSTDHHSLLLTIACQLSVLWKGPFDCLLRECQVALGNCIMRLEQQAAVACCPSTAPLTAPVSFMNCLQVALEDSLVTMSTILSSRFVAGIRPDVEKVERQLTSFSDTLDQWVQVKQAP
jgi:hypothetical protein